jgi:hypothetical protein
MSQSQQARLPEIANLKSTRRTFSDDGERAE